MIFILHRSIYYLDISVLLNLRFYNLVFQIVMCENNISNQTIMNQVMTHELIHAFDVCRVRYDKESLRHLACTEVC